jgi:hypothetical protein
MATHSILITFPGSTCEILIGEKCNFFSRMHGRDFFFLLFGSVEKAGFVIKKDAEVGEFRLQYAFSTRFIYSAPLCLAFSGLYTSRVEIDRFEVEDKIRGKA